MAVLTPRMVPPVPRANLLVGKLGILQQTPAGFAKEFPHNPLAEKKFVAVLQQRPEAGKFLTAARHLL